MEAIAERAANALRKHDLCDHCLGRLFAREGTGTTNLERGRKARALAGGEGPPHESCWLCDGLFDGLGRYASAAMEKLSEIEYGTFLIGTKIDPEVQDREERLWAEVGGDKAEPIKAELNREIGKLIEAATGRKAEFATPDVVARVDTRFGHVELDVSPLFIYGRYLKPSREIPQTRWPCRECRGKGCPRCNGIGRMYRTSVQEIIGDIALEWAQGEDHFLHGMGREDIDARMLGTGRPFVLEISEPKIRSLDLAKLEEEANKAGEGVAGYIGLRWSSREEVRRVKGASPDKEYVAEVQLQGKVNMDKVNEVVRSLSHARIVQQTPARVAHRRADLARERQVRELQILEAEGQRLVLRLLTESGTYVKEFISGDNGRTSPSLAAELGVACVVTALDVVRVLDNVNEG